MREGWNERVRRHFQLYEANLFVQMFNDKGKGAEDRPETRPLLDSSSDLDCGIRDSDSEQCHSANGTRAACIELGEFGASEEARIGSEASHDASELGWEYASLLTTDSTLVLETTGTCHKCGAKLSRQKNAGARCLRCGCKFHTTDCGKRCLAGGIDTRTD